MIDWTAIKNALHAWASAAMGITTVWADQNAPAPAYPFGVLKIIAGPVPVGRDELRQSQDLAIVADVALTPIVQPNATYTVTINGVPGCTYISDGTPTLAEICAGITAAMIGPVMTVNHGTYVRIVGSVTFTLGVSANLSWVNLDAGHEIALAATGQRTMTVSCQAVGAGALGYVTAAQAALGLPGVRYALRAAGLAFIDAGAVQDLTAIANAQQLQRAAMDVRFGLASEVSERTGYIAQAELDSDALGIDHETFGEQP